MSRTRTRSRARTAPHRWSGCARVWSTGTTSAGARDWSANVKPAVRSTGAPTPRSRVGRPPPVSKKSKRHWSDVWEFASPYSDVVRGDGDGWVVSDGGGHFWGRHGAAGLLLRAPWSHQGGTWALPGGARDSHESVEEAAVREAYEEAGVQAVQMTVRV